MLGTALSDRSSRLHVFSSWFKLLLVFKVMRCCSWLALALAVVPRNGVSAAAMRWSASVVAAVLAALCLAMRSARLAAARVLTRLAFHGFTLLMSRHLFGGRAAFGSMRGLRCFIGGRGVESRSVLVTQIPSCPRTVTTWLLALCVACAS